MNESLTEIKPLLAGASSSNSNYHKEYRRSLSLLNQRLAGWLEKNHLHIHFVPLYVVVFFVGASFAIIVPSVAPYLKQVQSLTNINIRCCFVLPFQFVHAFVTVCYNGGRTKLVVVVLIIVYSCVVPKRTTNKTKLSS